MFVRFVDAAGFVEGRGEKVLLRRSWVGMVSDIGVAAVRRRRVASDLVVVNGRVGAAAARVAGQVVKKIGKHIHEVKRGGGGEVRRRC